MCVGQQPTAWHSSPIGDSSHFLFLEVLEYMQRKYHIRTYQKEEYCFINLPINDLQQAAASLKELNFSILCTEA